MKRSMEHSMAEIETIMAGPIAIPRGPTAVSPAFKIPTMVVIPVILDMVARCTPKIPAMT
jgi:hypothetical protein